MVFKQAKTNEQCTLLSMTATANYPHFIGVEYIVVTAVFEILIG